MKNQKQTKELLYFAALLILVLVIIYSGLQILESTVLRPEYQTVVVERKTITRDGVDYFPRQDVTTVLVLGIDQFGPVEDSGTYNNQGAADMNLLLIFDEVAETCNVIQFNRDTMVEMPILGLGGRQAGTLYGQLALAHTYGTGLADSCENSRETISNLLHGIKIDYYVSMNMDAISILNDAVGGVWVTVRDDFSKVDDSIPMGSVLLQGEQAITFVRSRANVADQLNVSRMERHKEYLNGFIAAYRTARQENSELLVEVYDQISPYLITDCSVNAISGMIERYGDYTVGEVISPAGENIRGEEYYEFHLNQAAFDELALRLLYAPKK